MIIGDTTADLQADKEGSTTLNGNKETYHDYINAYGKMLKSIATKFAGAKLKEEEDKGVFVETVMEIYR